MDGVGSKRWAIAEGFIPSGGISGDRALESHEAFCVLNAGRQDANLNITLFFTDRPPAGPYRIRVAAERTMHVRANDLDDPEPVPRDTDYAVLIDSDAPIVVQHTRLDSRHDSLALLSAGAQPVR